MNNFINGIGRISEILKYLLRILSCFYDLFDAVMSQIYHNLFTIIESLQQTILMDVSMCVRLKIFWILISKIYQQLTCFFHYSGS